jgi:hypothetical protein
MNPTKTACIITFMLLFIIQTAGASAYYQNKIVKDKDSDINVTIMRWGTPDQESGFNDAKKDRIIGQISSMKYRQAVLIFESNPINFKKYQLIINTAVHVYKPAQAVYPHCTICAKGRSSSYSGGNNATGAQASGGCYFELFFPYDKSMGKLRLVDVKAHGEKIGNGDVSAPDESVTYFTNFNVSPDLLRSPMKIPVPQRARLHETTFSLRLVDVRDTERPPEPEVPSTPVIPGEVKDNSITFDHPLIKELEQHSKKLIEQKSKNDNQLCVSYISALADLASRAKQSINQPLFNDVVKERDRFAESKSVPESDIASNPEIKKLQLILQSEQRDLNIKMDDLTAKLAQWYLTRLNVIQEEYTKKEKFDDVLKICGEIAKVKANSNYVIERFEDATFIKASPK